MRIVVVPDARIPAKTASLYARLSPEDFSDGSLIAAQTEHLRSSLALDATLLRNAFARPLYALVPALTALPDIMRDAGAASALRRGQRCTPRRTDRRPSPGATRRPRPGLRCHACSASALIV